LIFSLMERIKRAFSDIGAFYTDSSTFASSICVV
jgi:hypothetical protein